MTDFTISSFRIGVDGGGTKTELILVDAAGAIVATHLAPGCNPSHVGSAKAREILVAGLDALLAQSGIEDPHSKIGLTQLYMAGSPAFWREVASSLTDYGIVTSGPDALPVLELATGGSAGLVLHAGTGSFVAARDAGGMVHYAGGLGWKLGDGGSGFDLGRRAIAQALLDLQAGSASPSLLAEALRAHTGLADYAAHSRFFYHDASANATIAAFAPRALELAEQDCGPAQQVVADSVADLARLADQVIQRRFPSPSEPVPCGVSGRILNSGPASRELRAVAEALRWPVVLNFITESPTEGVRRLVSKL